MRSRLMVVLVGALVLFATSSLFSAASAATTTSGVVAVQTGNQGSEGGDGQGQDDPDAETGASEEESQGGATETGPPWTYQMAWISIGGVVLLLLGCAYLYWRLVVVRSRGEA